MGRISIGDKGAVFAFRGIVFLSLFLLLVNSPRQEQSLNWAPFLMAGLYLATSVALWRSTRPRLNSWPAQAAAYLWDVGVVSAVLYSSEGFADDLYLMYFLIMFMSGLMTQIRQSFLIGTVASLIYAALWLNGKVAVGLPETNLLLRFAFFYVTAFFTAIMAGRVRAAEERSRGLELKIMLARIANGGWGRELAEEMGPRLDPDIARSMRTINALVDNLSQALKRTMSQNEDLRETAHGALMHLARERERLEAAAGAKAKAPPA